MKTISVQDLKAKIDSGENVNIVDVREPFEHEEFNIGGVLLPIGEIRNGDTSSIDHLRDQQVFLYCRSGNRSGQACLVLETMGFANVVNVSGGMLAWREQFPG